jgi:hypothetical protein
MATYTSNYGWTKPSGSDNVDISVLNNNLDDQDSTIHDAFLNMAPPFSESSTYAVDDIVLYGTGIYKCHTAVVTPGSWTGSTNWQVYKLSEGGSGSGGTSNYNQLTNKPQINHVELSGNKTAAQLGLMASDGVVANPTGQTTGTLTTLEVGGTKYAVGGGSSLEAGDYIDITEGVISVKKEKGEYSLERYVLQSTGGGAPKLVVKKYIDSELISTNEYANNTAHVNIDDTLEIWYSYNPYNWHYKLLVDGVDHSAGYEYEFSYTDTTEYPVDFHISAGDSTDLVTKGDLEEVATSGSYADLSSKPQVNGVELSGNKTASQLGMANSNTFQGTIAEWNNLTTAEKKAYDHASIPDSIDGGVTFPANKVVMTGGGNVEDALNTQRVVTVASVTANGVKTYRQLLNEIYTSQTGNDNVILSLGGEMHQQYFGVTYYGGLMTAGGGLLLSFIRLDSANSQYKTYGLTTSSSPLEDKSLLVPVQGTVIKLIKFL